MKNYLYLLLLIFLFSCSGSSLKKGMDRAGILNTIGKPDSVRIEKGIPDIYTNKIINIEVWFYGKDSSIILANNKVQTIKINTVTK